MERTQFKPLNESLANIVSELFTTNTDKSDEGIQAVLISEEMGAIFGAISITPVPIPEASRITDSLSSVLEKNARKEAKHFMMGIVSACTLLPPGDSSSSYPDSILDLVSSETPKLTDEGEVPAIKIMLKILATTEMLSSKLPKAIKAIAESYEKLQALKSLNPDNKELLENEFQKTKKALSQMK